MLIYNMLKGIITRSGIFPRLAILMLPDWLIAGRKERNRKRKKSRHRNGKARERLRLKEMGVCAGVSVDQDVERI